MTKITKVSTRIFSVPLDRLLGDVNDPKGRQVTNQMVVEVHGDNGLAGMAIGHPTSHAIVADLGAMLIGENANGVRDLWQRMVDRAFKGGLEGVVKEAICHLDVALWDLKAKSLDMPLWRLLGGSSPEVAAYASGIDSPLTDEEIRKFYTSMAAKGVNFGKLKVGRSPEDDFRRLEIMRESLQTSGKPARLAIDSNEYWGPKEAIARIRALEREFDLVWVEEPARRWDAVGLRKVSDAVTAAVATGENLNSTADFLPLMQAGAVDIVQVGQYTSGITGALQVAELATAFELPVALMNCPGDFMAHLGSVLPNHAGVEIVDIGFGRLVDNNQTITDGWICLPDLPGLGMRLRDDIEQFELEALPTQASTSTPGRIRYGSLADRELCNNKV